MKVVQRRLNVKQNSVNVTQNSIELMQNEVKVSQKSVKRISCEKSEIYVSKNISVSKKFCEND